MGGWLVQMQKAGDKVNGNAGTGPRVGMAGAVVGESLEGQRGDNFTGAEKDRRQAGPGLEWGSSGGAFPWSFGPAQFQGASHLHSTERGSGGYNQEAHFIKMPSGEGWAALVWCPFNRGNIKERGAPLSPNAFKGVENHQQPSTGQPCG